MEQAQASEIKTRPPCAGEKEPRHKAGVGKPMRCHHVRAPAEGGIQQGASAPGVHSKPVSSLDRPGTIHDEQHHSYEAFPMRMSFHKDTVDVTALCRDLREHGAVYWHTSRPNFDRVSKLVSDAGVSAIGLCARPDGDFLNFMVRADLVGCDLAGLLECAAVAISAWQAKGEPVPHVEVL